MRIFIAFSVPEHIKTLASTAGRELQKKYPFFKARWAHTGNMHVTLEFLGSLTEKQLQTVRDILTYQTKKVPSFLYTVTGITAFPNVYRPETLVLAVGETETAFSVFLRKAVHEELSLYNLSRDFKLWRPHITLARVKNPGGLSLPDVAAVSVARDQWSISELELIESKLTAHGSLFTTLDRFKFGK